MNRPQVEFESALTHCRKPSHVVQTSTIAVCVCVCVNCMWSWIVCPCVGWPPVSLLVFHDNLQTVRLRFYTTRTHRLFFFFSSTCNLTVPLVFPLCTSNVYFLYFSPRKSNCCVCAYGCYTTGLFESNLILKQSI